MVRVRLVENMVVGGVLYTAGTTITLPSATIEEAITGKAITHAPVDKMITGADGVVKRKAGRPPKITIENGN